MRKNWAALALTGMLCLTTFAGIQTVSAETADSAKQVDIVFTHDTHSHLNTFTTIVDEAEKEVGGFARINTLIQEQKAKNPDTLVIDGGDFSMGTLIQTVYDTEAAELRMLGYLGYDADNKEVYIPNEEIREEFIRAIKNGRRQELVKAIQLSDHLLKATINLHY